VLSSDLLKKHPNRKTWCGLVQNGQCKKVAKSKAAAKKWLWWYRFMTITIQVNFVLIPCEAGMRQHKFTWIVVIKILLSTYTITAISWLLPWFQSFFHIKTGPQYIFFAIVLFLSRLFITSLLVVFLKMIFLHWQLTVVYLLD